MARGKWIRGNLEERISNTPLGYCSRTHGTRLVWNSFKSTLSEPSNRRDAVMDETTWAMSLFKLVKLGAVMFKFFLQIS